MTDNPRLPAETVAYIEDMIGADINRDLLKVAISSQDIGELTVNNPTGRKVSIALDEVGGQSQSSKDIAQLIEDISTLTAALDSNNADVLRVTDTNGGPNKDVDIVEQSVGNIQTDIQAYNAGNLPTEVADRSANTYQLASSEDISSGVSQSLSDNESFTLFLNANGSIEVTVSLSPDGGTTSYEVTESPVSFSSAGDETIKLSYDTDWIEISGSNTTNVTAQIREII